MMDTVIEATLELTYGDSPKLWGHDALAVQELPRTGDQLGFGDGGMFAVEVKRTTIWLGDKKSGTPCANVSLRFEGTATSDLKDELKALGFYPIDVEEADDDDEA
jgi:hypothetical protein